MQTENDNPYVMIVPGPDYIEVSWAYHILVKDEESGKFSCFIPSFDIYFTCSDQEVIIRKAKAITTMFFDHFIKHSKNNLKSLAIELNKLGFRANNHMLVMKHLVNNQAEKAKFRANQFEIPEHFAYANKVMSESGMQIPA